ncbi:VOC family protein [Devosia neptuniae]|jgi:glyoxylase I family protein|uniref:VOC family protein n=1 Tax=Devosia TaxID=46913 RepID=UPI0022AEEBE1|nr:VOC family protein [Devosia neptuniae]MCZ4347817.1 VOC family protein [Devosia neptuniae]|tara:strand:- start:1604 stop:1987 length:384 start_codon:yes stop_codon:yes gene_type:complete
MSFKPKSASIVYYVSDIERTETFYNQTLGLGLERMEGAEPFWLQGSLEGGLELIFFQQEAVRGNTPAIIFTVPDGGIDDVVADLATKGVTIVTPVSEAPGGWSADFLDPDGFGIGLWQSEEFPRSLK